LVPAVIHGIVTDIDTGNPIPDATVYRIPGNRVSCNASGSYIFTGLATGTYRIYASAPGYYSSSPVSATVEEGLTYRLNVALSKVPTEGEGELPGEGEPWVEGEPVVGEGEPVAEGEIPEGEGEPGPDPCGCGCGDSKNLAVPGSINRMLGDWLLVGLSIVALLGLSSQIR